jgi:hypothetical protein
VRSGSAPEHLIIAGGPDHGNDAPATARRTSSPEP